MLVLLVIVVGGAAWVAYRTFLAPAAPSPTPSQTAAAPAAEAARRGPIATTEATIAKAAEARAPLEELTGGASAAAVEQEASVAAAPASDAIQAEAPLPQKTSPATPEPGVAFKSWVQGVRISSVRAGSSPRVSIEQTAYGAGDLVNPQLGIRFVGYDADTRMLRFQDRTGAVVERRY